MRDYRDLLSTIGEAMWKMGIERDNPAYAAMDSLWADLVESPTDAARPRGQKRYASYTPAMVYEAQEADVWRIAFKLGNGEALEPFKYSDLLQRCYNLSNFKDTDKVKAAILRCVEAGKLQQMGPREQWVLGGSDARGGKWYRCVKNTVTNVGTQPRTSNWPVDSVLG